MAFGVKTNERPGTRAQVRYVRFSAYKAREVLDLIRNEPVDKALEILQFTERDPAIVIGKCLASAVANAEHNDALPADELFVSACYADEGPTLKRWRPRARGRATRIRKRTCHITVIVSRYSDDQLRDIRRREDARTASSGGRSRGRGDAAASRRRRVARSKGEEAVEETTATAEAEVDAPTDEVVADDVEETTDTAVTEDAGTDDADTDEADAELEAEAVAEDDTTDEVVEDAADAADEAADAESDTEEQD
jgi:large subunit ribosomal protein L22